MHVGIFGPTRSGKTTLAQKLAAEYAKTGRAVLVCDPIGVNWPAAAWQTPDPLKLLAKAKASRNCAVFIEEASLSIDRKRNLSWLFVAAGNPAAGGHLTHVIGQDGASLLPAMRQQLATVYLFRCHPDLAETWSRQFAQTEVKDLAPTLEQYEFLRIKAFSPVQKCRLAL